MDRLIRQRDAIDTVTKYCTKYDLRELLADIEVLPSAESEQKTGKWIVWGGMDVPENHGRHKCSECGEFALLRCRMTREDIVRDVVGYEGLYKVDIFGNVIRVKDGKEVSQQINQFGYANVSLQKNGKQKQHKLHRVIAEAFIPNPYNKPQVNHIDGNKLHNVVWNLEWSTAKENINHSIKTNLRFIKKVEIVETGKIYDSVTECANDIGGSYGNIYHCLKGRRQTHKNYHFREV